MPQNRVRCGECRTSLKRDAPSATLRFKGFGAVRRWDGESSCSQRGARTYMDSARYRSAGGPVNATGISLSSLSLPPSLSLSLSPSLSLSFPPSPLSLSLSLPLSLSLSLPLSLSFFLSLTLFLTHTLSLSLPPPRSLSHSLCLSLLSHLSPL